jgi:SAM-dependent methyltransferase
MQWFRRSTTPEAREPDLTTEAIQADAQLAYKLVLAREPDLDGLRHYAQRLARGLSFRALVGELLNSPEYRGHHAPISDATGVDPSVPPVPDPVAADTTITPADVIARYSVEELIEAADEYYRGIADATALMSRPFAYLHEAPVMLQNMGALLAGLQLGKKMTVLEFGAGTCWLSRWLAQLNCQPICCDASRAALDIGRRLFAEHPLIGPAMFAPVFLPFDGHRIELEDESVDRIVCFDALHHVANVDEVIREFSRVLREGGIAGFSEPGRDHSRSAQAQYEMRDHRVLENDVDPRAIFAAARPAGFTQLTARVASDLEVSVDHYQAIVERRGADVQRAIWNNTCDTMRSRTVFFLHKGETRRDSRSHVGLAHAMSTTRVDDRVARGAPLRIDLRIDNTGQAAWLSRNIRDYGIVRVGTHLYDRHATLIAVDHTRHDLPRDVGPGESIDITIEVPLPADGEFVVGIDLVAEGVIWFEHVGSRTLMAPARRD